MSTEEKEKQDQSGQSNPEDESSEGKPDDPSDNQSDEGSDSKQKSQQNAEERREQRFASAKLKNLVNEVEKREYQYDYSYSWGGDEKKDTKFTVMPKVGTTRYSDYETAQANHLLRMMDISFDPTSDRVNTLRSGKLDVSKIAEIPGGNLNVYYKVEEKQPTRPFSVCILGDESSSMQWLIGKQRSAIKVLYKA